MSQLHYDLVNENEHATKNAIFLHGIMGAGKNLKTFASTFTSQFPEYRAVLIDLPNHGRSTSKSNTLDLCAQDLVHFLKKENIIPHMVIGHSYGGKVAFSLAECLQGKIEQLWSLDSLPVTISLNEGRADAFSAFDIVKLLKTLPTNFSSRSDLVRQVTSAGVPRPVALFLTTSLVSSEKGLTWRFELDVISAMLSDFEKRSYLDFLSEGQGYCQYHVVRAERNARWTPEMIHSIEKLGNQSRVSLHLLKDAGHWVHVDNPSGLLDLMKAYVGE